MRWEKEKKTSILMLVNQLCLCMFDVKRKRCLTLIESSCCLKASSASLLGENILLCRELLGGSVVGTANTLPSESPTAVDPSSERGRLRPPEESEQIKCHMRKTSYLSVTHLLNRKYRLAQKPASEPSIPPAFGNCNLAIRTDACCRPQLGLRTPARGPFAGGVRT